MNKRFLLIGFGVVFILFLIVATGLDLSLLPNKKKEITKNNLSTISTVTQRPLIFSSPIENSSKRVTKKPFGIETNDRFQGFHTGADFETFPEESLSVVRVMAICGGKLILKEQASGYGGVIVQSCDLKNEPITVIYGHMKLTSVKVKIDESVKVGDVLGELGAAYSSETDGERKHLHLGIHKGNEINILGYVNLKDELSSWIDPCDFLCK
jgi:murein DD-endopeptidase MepM/ murein hydrolase activator NlpD